MTAPNFVVRKYLYNHLLTATLPLRKHIPNTSVVPQVPITSRKFHHRFRASYETRLPSQMMLTAVESQLESLNISKTMAEAAGAQSAPTFKLVLVGDGGTGKVSGQT